MKSFQTPFRYIFGTVLLLQTALTMIHAQVPRDFAVDLQASVSDTAPCIKLSWTQRLQSSISSQTIYRRLKGDSTWGSPLATLSTTQTSYIDNTAAPGIEYEYWMKRTLNIAPGMAIGYISAGVKVPEVNSRGKLLLLVDTTMVAPLAPEIAQLTADLTADGWTVQQITAPRDISGGISSTTSGQAALEATTKALVQAAYNSDPANVKMLYILGHVPIAYSGNLYPPDGHSDQSGAWPADGYYGDMTGPWTDTTINVTHFAPSQNIPGDGRFDPSTFPAPVNLQVGRVDLFNIPTAPSNTVSETSLLRRYLRKAHDFRYKQGAYADIQRRSLILDNVGILSGGTEPIAINTWAPAFTCVAVPPSAAVVDESPFGQWFNYGASNSYLLGFAGGGGNNQRAFGVGTSTMFGRQTSQVLFISTMGSGFGNWGMDDDFMRAILAGNADGTSLGLTCSWVGRPNYFMHHMGMGETIGYSTRVSQNAGIYYLNGVSYADSYQPIGISIFSGYVHVGLMGDPALRLHMVQPPRDLAGTSANSQVTLGWTASTENNLQGYHVYRAGTSAGPFTRLTSTPLAGTTYTDTTGTSGQSYAYMVRTLKLESVPGGSYYNLSLGTSATLTVNAGATGAPLNPGDLTAAAVSSTSAQLTWTDNANNETSYRIERKINANGAYTALSTPASNTSSYTDIGPFAAGNVYYYRVFATGTAGDSIASNEVSFEASNGFVDFSPISMMKVSKTVGTAQIPVSRFGGSMGAITLNYSAVNSSAVAGTHFTAPSGTLSWADGETGVKYISAPITNTPAPQQARQFRISLNSVNGGASLGQYGSCAVLIEDPAATLSSPWSQTVFQGSPQANQSVSDSSPATDAEGEIGSTTMGGPGFNGSASVEAGQFIYQPKTGDGALTAFVPPSIPAQPGARFAVMVRQDSTGTGAIMGATVASSDAINFGTKFIYRTSVYGNSVISGTSNTQSTPQWIRITRSGNTFTSECSANGTVWTTIGVANIPMTATAQWGLFHLSDNQSIESNFYGDYQLATFQNVSFGSAPVTSTPAGFALLASTSTSAQLSWTPSAYAGGYRIERRDESGAFALLVNTPDGSLSTYTDNTVVAGSAYQYRIVAYNGTGDSAWSSVLSMGTPTGLITTDLTPEADAVVLFDSPATPLGSGTLLTVAGLDPVTSALTPVAKSYLRFNLAGLGSIQSATLKLTFLASRNLTLTGYFDMEFDLLTPDTADAWNESTIDWNNAPNNDTAGNTVLSPSQYLGEYYVYNLTDFPAVGAQASTALDASALNANIGSNHLVTIAMTLPWDGAQVDWASRENPSCLPPTLEVTAISAQPIRPGFLTVSPGTGSNIALAWTDNSNNETGFLLQRRAANGAWALLAPLAPNTTSYTDATALPGVIYEYRIAAASALGNSTWATIFSGLQHTSAATVNNPVASPDGAVFNQIDAPTGSGYVPNGFMYYPATPIGFAAGQNLYQPRNTSTEWQGMKITVGATPLIIEQLARWVISSNTGTHVVKIVNAAGVDVSGGTVTIATAGAPVGFKYVSLATPVTLAANTSYYIVSWEPGGGDNFYDGNSQLSYSSSVATVIGSAYSSNGTTYQLSGYAAGTCYGPLDFKYTTTPPVPFTTGQSMTTLRNDTNGWLGMKLTVGASDIVVNQLGRWIVAGNTGTHAVKLVNATTRANVAAVTVATAGASAGQIQYAPLSTTVTLTANTSYYLLSQETAGGDQWYDYSFLAPGTATGYQSWLLTNGLPMDASANGSATATPANDGLSNLMKYALSLAPGVSGNGGHLSYGKVTDSGNEYLSLTYVCPNPAPGDITYKVETSPDLSPGSWTASGVVQLSNTPNGNLMTVTVRNSTPMTGGNKSFMRLKITQP